ncbi:MAG TPA: Ig-like domain-containing protein [Verrucomicrobiae bacterium]|nr:Ig-like domain-containing protein [Verrucomicrobiae bacterium]
MCREANHRKSTLTVLCLALASSWPAMGQVTNWVAYNDHRPGPTIPPHISHPTNWGTALRVTTMNMGAPADTSGNLTNFLDGQQLPVTVTFTRNNAPDDFGTVTRPGIPDPGTPAFQLFYGVCDLSNDGIVGVDLLDNDFVTITFNNLDPAKRYLFRGTAARGGGYAPRWTVATISAGGWIDAHLNGTGPGVITSNSFPNLGAGQAAWNSGHNREGAVVGWDFITPHPDGSFAITNQQYVGPTPNGGAATDANYGYSFGAMLLAEVEVAPPVITAHPVATTSVEQNRPFSLSVAATGSPLLYQWYKEGAGPVAGATFPKLSVAKAALSDSGQYYAVVYNPLTRATSSVAQVTVFADTTAPAIRAAIPYPTVDPIGGVGVHDQIIVEYNEPVQATSVNSTTQYTVPGGGNPVSVIVTNDTTVVLKLAAPLALDTDYSVSATGAIDEVGNTAGALSSQFRTWITGAGNGLLFEAFETDPGVEVSILTSSPNYPDNPYLQSTLSHFDTRLVFADDNNGNYGGRIRGVFIPPVSGNWSFFLRTFDRGVVYLNPNGLDPAGAMEILRESTGNNPRNWDKFTSAPFFLRAGEGYYIEGLYKADTSGVDVMKVAARLTGTGFPQPVDTLDTMVDSNALAGASIAYPLAPRDLGGTLTILQDPVNTTVEDNHFPVFSVQLSNPSKAAIFYQWFRDGSPIPGANGPTYTFQAVAADSGATFSVQASKIGSSVSSGSATLTVVPDVTPPHALSARSYPSNLNVVIVQFDELMFKADAEDYFNYSIAELVTANPNTAILEADGRTVTLTFSEALVSNVVYNLDIILVTDLVRLKIDPDPTRLTFTAGVVQGPGLEITHLANNAVISWPAPSTGFILEQTDTLVLPAGTIWAPVGVTPSVINGRNTVTIPISGTRIYRLRQ